MPYYKCKVIDARGQTLEKKVEAENEALVRIQMDRLGLTTTEIKQISQIEILLSNRKISKKDLASFCKQLSHLLKAGISLHKGVELIGEQTKNPSFAAIIEKVVQDLKDGIPMSQACAKYRKVFPESMSFQIEAAESGGFMSEALLNISEGFERDASFTKKVKGAMIYPISVLVITLGIVYFMLAMVVPSMAETLASFDSELPPITLFVMKLSDIAKNQWYLFLGIIGALVYGIHYVMKDEEKRRVIDKYLLKVPVLGTLIININISRISQVMSALLSTGVPIDDTLDSLKNIVTNTVFKDALIEVKKDVVEKGISLSKSMETKAVFPKTMIQVILVGEESGNISTVLVGLSETLEEEVTSNLNTLTNMINPILMVVIGAIVGVVVLSLFLPMFALIDNF